MGNMAQATKKEILYLYADRIRPNPKQPRKVFEIESLKELANSIKEYGILQPISVRYDGRNYEIVAGERRLRAAKLAGLTYVPCIVININEKQSAVLAIIENLQRQNLNYIEEAEGFANLIHDFGFTQEQLATQVGKTQSTVANKLRLLKLDPKIKEKLLASNLTERHARALLKLPDVSSQMLILDKVISQDLNVKKTEWLIEQYTNATKEPEEEKEKKRKIKIVLRDIRIFTNTITEAVDFMRNAGINTEYKLNKTDDGYNIVINLKTDI